MYVGVGALYIETVESALFLADRMNHAVYRDPVTFAMGVTCVVFGFLFVAMSILLVLSQFATGESGLRRILAEVTAEEEFNRQKE